MAPNTKSSGATIGRLDSLLEHVPWLTRFLPRSRAGKGAVSLAAASAVAQSLAAIASPLLTRIYSPADFGAAAVFSSILSFAAVIGSLRYELAVPLPSRDRDARRLVLLCACVLACTTSALGVVVLLARGRIADVLGAPVLSEYLWLSPLALLGVGSYQVLSYYALRRQAYSRLAQTKVAQSVAGLATGVSLGLAFAGPIGLILSGVASQSAGVLSLSRELLEKPDVPAHAAKRSLRSVLPNLTTLAKRYQKFPCFAAPASLLNTAGLQLSPILFSVFYGPESTGRYSLALRVVGIPMAIVGQAVGQVFLGEASSTTRREDPHLWPLMKRSTKRLLPLSVGLLCLGFLSPLCFGFIFGLPWTRAGWFAALLSIFGAAQLLTSPISTVAYVVERQEVQLALDGLRVALVVAAFLGARLAGATDLQTLGAFVLAMSCVYGASFFLYRRLAISHDSTKTNRPGFAGGSTP